jgi:hypothetical protein
MVANSNFSIITAVFSLQTKMCISPHAQRGKRQIKARLKGHSRTVGLQHGTCFMSPFWCLEFSYGSHIFGKFYEPIVKATFDNNTSEVKTLQVRVWLMTKYYCGLVEP